MRPWVLREAEEELIEATDTTLNRKKSPHPPT
jgi:hypothetical protein